MSCTNAKDAEIAALRKEVERLTKEFRLKDMAYERVSSQADILLTALERAPSLRAVALALNLPPDADASLICNSIHAERVDAQTERERIALALGLPEDATAERVVEAAGDAAKDTKRLDWLESSLAEFSQEFRIKRAPVGNISVGQVIVIGRPLASVRDAIDAALAKGGE